MAFKAYNLSDFDAFLTTKTQPKAPYPIFLKNLKLESVIG